jgi:uncharacterized protein
MSDSYLHGVEVVEIRNGARSIQSVTSSIIGIVGTAPDSEGAVTSTLSLGSGTSALTFTALKAGEDGNDIAVRIVNPGTASAELACALTETNGTSLIKVSLATDDKKAATSTADAVKTAVAAVAGIAALVSVASGGAGVVSPCAVTYLAGGKNEAFPLDTPVELLPNDTAWARLGNEGSLARAIDNIWKQCATPLVVVRVAQTTDDSDVATVAAVAGSSGDRTGVFALLNAESVTGLKPRILVAPGFAQQPGVVSSLVSVASSLHGWAIADGPNTTDAAAINAALGYGSDRIYMVDPYVAVERDEGTVYEPSSSFVAGIIAKVDNEEGFWVSPSNHTINGITGTKRAIDFTLGDASSRANLLNASNVATIIRQNGWRLWGNRTLSEDSTYAFLCVRRTADIINDSILKAHLWAVDRSITKNYVTEVTESVNAYMRTLIAMGAIVGDQDATNKVNCCWLDADLNSEANIAAGRIYFDFAFTAAYPAERVTFRSELNTNGLTSILS